MHFTFANTLSMVNKKMPVIARNQYLIAYNMMYMGYVKYLMADSTAVHCKINLNRTIS